MNSDSEQNHSNYKDIYLLTIEVAGEICHRHADRFEVRVQPHVQAPPQHVIRIEPHVQAPPRHV